MSTTDEANTDDPSAHRYTPGGAPIRRNRQRLDPYGMKGFFRLCYERTEEYMD